MACTLLFAGPVRAGQDDPALPALFKLLRTSVEGPQANLLQHQIWVIWHQHDDPDLSRLLNRGITAMHEADHEVALAAFDAVIEMDPRFAEGWNKRATLYYMLGDYDRSVLDIQKTLELEPRHFGALSGLGLINMALGRTDAAIAAFEQTIAVNPHATGARHNIEMLRKAKEREKI
jgi:tetratricopeptide (TPR) repeat protein